MRFLCLEPRETDKNVLKFAKNLVLKFHLLLLGEPCNDDPLASTVHAFTDLSLATSHSSRFDQMQLKIACLQTCFRCAELVKCVQLFANCAQIMVAIYLVIDRIADT